MDIQLRTNQQHETFRLGDVKRFADGSGYRTVLQVQSRDFEASIPFYFEPQPLGRFLDELVAMDRSLIGSAKLQPLFEGHFIELTLTPRGSVVVRGEVFEYSEHSQHLKFEFETDQTVLKPLVDDIRECLQLAAS